jgi:hypothetical protein
MKIYRFGDREPSTFCFLIFKDIKYRIGLHPHKDFMKIQKSEYEFVDKMSIAMMDETNPQYIIKALFE